MGDTLTCLSPEPTKLLLKSNSHIKDNRQLLNEAVKSGCKENVEILLKQGVNINARDEDGRTALHLAAKWGYQEIIKLLLNFGADIDSTDKYGKTTLHIANDSWECDHGDIFETILEYGADINITTEYSWPFARRPFTIAKIIIVELDPDDPSYYHYYNYILNNHLVKMKVANLYLNAENLKFYQYLQEKGGNELKNYEQKCREELTKIKSEKVANSKITFHDILMKSTQTLAAYSRNENIIIQLLSTEDLKTKFPIYAVLMKGQIRKGMERKELLDSNREVIGFFFNNLLELPIVCSDKILSNFSNKELRAFVDTLNVIHASNSNGSTVINDN